MAKVLKLHWSRSKPNFGDWLSPALCELLSRRRVEYAAADDCDLVAVGSLFDRLPNGWLRRQVVDVWGTGSIEGHAPVHSRHRFHAVRGPRTAGLVRNATVNVLGDPGLLAEMLLPEARRLPTRWALGIVPHYKDVDAPAVLELHERVPGSVVVDVFEPPAEVVKRIAQCGHVISSSLHGLVVADGLNIPARWLEVSNQVRGQGWKFHDHYEAIGVSGAAPLVPARLRSSWSLDALFCDYQPHNLDGVKLRLLESFPYAP